MAIAEDKDQHNQQQFFQRLLEARKEQDIIESKERRGFFDRISLRSHSLGAANTFLQHLISKESIVSRFFDVRYKQNINFSKIEERMFNLRRSKFGDDKEF